MTENEEQTAEEKTEAIHRKVYDELASRAEPKAEEVPEVEETKEEPEEASVEAEPEEAAPEEEETPSEPNAEYEKAIQRLKFAHLDPDELGLSEAQAIKFAATLRDEQVQRDRVLNENADIKRQLGILQAGTPNDATEQVEESGRPTSKPTEAPTVNVSEYLQPIAEAMGLEGEDSDKLGLAIQQIVQASTQAERSRSDQLEALVIGLAQESTRTRYGDRFPKATSDPQAFQDLLNKAQALHAATPDGDFEESMSIIYRGIYPDEGSKATPEPPKAKPRKTSSTPSTQKPVSKVPTTQEELDRALYDKLSKQK